MTETHETLMTLLAWLRKRGEPDSGINYSGPWSDEVLGRQQSQVRLFDHDADFIAKHFHGQGARDLADALEAALSRHPLPSVGGGEVLIVKIRSIIEDNMVGGTDICPAIMADGLVGDLLDLLSALPPPPAEGETIYVSRAANGDGWAAGPNAKLESLFQAIEGHDEDTLPLYTAVERVHIIFDGPPSHESGRFVEVENDAGASIRAGEWIERPDGLWDLVITFRAATPASPVITEEQQFPRTLGTIHEAIDAYVDDLLARQHGGIAQDKAFGLICEALGRTPITEYDARRTAALSPSGESGK